MKSLTDYQNMSFDDRRFLIDRLEDYYISKLNGMDRIKKELELWEPCVRKEIIFSLIDSLKKSMILDRDEEELLSLI